MSINATCAGFIPLNDIPSAVASNVASSTKVDIARSYCFPTDQEILFSQ